MNNKITSLLPKIQNVINNYGIDVTIKRDIYGNEVGVNTLIKAGNTIATIKAVIDNSSSNISGNNYHTEGITKIIQTANIYYAYDSKLPEIKEGDYFIIDNRIYRLGQPQNLLHYNLVYQSTAEVTIHEF